MFRNFFIDVLKGLSIQLQALKQFIVYTGMCRLGVLCQTSSINTFQGWSVLPQALK